MEEKDYREDNEKRMLYAIAILLGMHPNGSYSIDKEYRDLVEKTFENNNLRQFTDLDARLPEQDIQKAVARVAYKSASQTQLYKIVGVKDDRTCADCQQWQNEIVSMTDDGKHKTVSDFINQHGFHPNCRCSLQKLDLPYNIRKVRNQLMYSGQIFSV